MTPAGSEALSNLRNPDHLQGMGIIQNRMDLWKESF